MTTYTNEDIEFNPYQQKLIDEIHSARILRDNWNKQYKMVSSGLDKDLYTSLKNFVENTNMDTLELSFKGDYHNNFTVYLTRSEEYWYSPKLFEYVHGNIKMESVNELFNTTRPSLKDELDQMDTDEILSVYEGLQAIVLQWTKKVLLTRETKNTMKARAEESQIGNYHKTKIIEEAYINKVIDLAMKGYFKFESNSEPRYSIPNQYDDRVMEFTIHSVSSTGKTYQASLYDYDYEGNRKVMRKFTRWTKDNIKEFLYNPKKDYLQKLLD